MQIYKTIDGLCLDEEEELNNKHYDAVIILARTFTNAGIENYLSIASLYSSKILIVYNNARLGIVNSWLDKKGKC